LLAWIPRAGVSSRQLRVSSVDRVVAEQQKQIQDRDRARLEASGANPGSECAGRNEQIRRHAVDRIAHGGLAQRSNRKLFGKETPTLIKSALVLELSHLKPYPKFSPTERSYAALKARPDVLPLTADGHAGASGKKCVRSSA
jgi:hypothetical protein